MEENQNKPRQAQPGDEYEVTPLGSLGLLALGDVGLKAWREAREKAGLKPGEGRQVPVVVPPKGKEEA